MLLTFTKNEYRSYSPEPGVELKDGSNYTLYEEGNKAGSFCFSFETSYISYGAKRYKISTRHYNFKKPEHRFIDLDSHEPMPIEFITPSARGVFEGPHLLAFHGERLRLYKETPDIPFRLFKKDTWGWEKYQLGSETHTVIFQMRNEPNSLEEITARGVIDSTSADHLLLFAALYLVAHFRHSLDT